MELAQAAGRRVRDGNININKHLAPFLPQAMM